LSHTGNSTEAAPEIEKPRRRWGSRLIGYVKRKYHQRRAKKKHESPADRAARRTASATIWMAVFTVVLATVSGLTLLILKRQLQEMHDGGVDTHKLASSASDQATWTQRLAGSADSQSGHMKDLADHMKDQSDRTKDLADQAKIQATESTIAAKAAKSAAETAKEALHISQRAYVFLGTPTHDFAHNQVNIPIVNSGHIPSGRVGFVVHEITFKVDTPGGGTFQLDDAHVIEKHWSDGDYRTVPIGNLYNVTVHDHTGVASEIDNGKQGVLVVAALSYNDGFPDSPVETVTFCDITGYMVDTKTAYMHPCTGDIEQLALKTAIFLDQYPSQTYHEK
jgi:hypothetical protein